MINLTLVELAELLDHLEEREDLWVFANGLWVRMKDDVPCMAVQVVSPPEPHSPHTLASLIPHPSAWSETESAEYLDRLARGWTSYGERMKAFHLLKTAAHLDEQTAYAAALVISTFYNGTAKEPEEPSTQPHIPELPPTYPDLAPVDRSLPDARNFFFQGGGWVRVSLQGEVFFTEMSLPSEYGGSTIHTRMKGHARAVGCSPRIAADYLFEHPREAVNPPVLEYQQRLESADA